MRRQLSSSINTGTCFTHDSTGTMVTARRHSNDSARPLTTPSSPRHEAAGVVVATDCGQRPAAKLDDGSGSCRPWERSAHDDAKPTVSARYAPIGGRASPTDGVFASECSVRPFNATQLLRIACAGRRQRMTVRATIAL